MGNLMRRLWRTAAFMVCVPLIGMVFVKPERDLNINEKERHDASVINDCFSVRVREDTGSFSYEPEAFVELMVYRMVPPDIQFSVSEDYVAGTGEAHDPEQEYLKALAIVCRSNIVSAWEGQGRPDILRYESMGFDRVCFYNITTDDTRSAEIHRAAAATEGAVVTDGEGVAVVPFFTSAPSDILVSQAGSGAGVSLNFSYELARRGMDFYEILKYFLGAAKIKIYGE